MSGKSAVLIFFTSSRKSHSHLYIHSYLDDCLFPVLHHSRITCSHSHSYSAIPLFPSFSSILPPRFASPASDPLFSHPFHKSCTGIDYIAPWPDDDPKLLYTQPTNVTRHQHNLPLLSRPGSARPATQRVLQRHAVRPRQADSRPQLHRRRRPRSQPECRLESASDQRPRQRR